MSHAPMPPYRNITPRMPYQYDSTALVPVVYTRPMEKRSLNARKRKRQQSSEAVIHLRPSHNSNQDFVPQSTSDQIGIAPGNSISSDYTDELSGFMQIAKHSSRGSEPPPSAMSKRRSRTESQESIDIHRSLCLQLALLRDELGRKDERLQASEEEVKRLRDELDMSRADQISESGSDYETSSEDTNMSLGNKQPAYYTAQPRDDAYFTREYRSLQDKIFSLVDEFLVKKVRRGLNMPVNKFLDNDSQMKELWNQSKGTPMSNQKKTSMALAKRLISSYVHVNIFRKGVPFNSAISDGLDELYRLTGDERLFRSSLRTAWSAASPEIVEQVERRAGLLEQGLWNDTILFWPKRNLEAKKKIKSRMRKIMMQALSLAMEAKKLPFNSVQYCFNLAENPDISTEINGRPANDYYANEGRLRDLSREITIFPGVYLESEPGDDCCTEFRPMQLSSL